MNPAVNDRTAPAVIVGAGPVGLATSRHFTALGVNHVVLERDTSPGRDAGAAGIWPAPNLEPHHAVRNVTGGGGMQSEPSCLLMPA
jgi:cation diffusion facilitator CzcD-associated flavoprotein CzcO